MKYECILSVWKTVSVISNIIGNGTCPVEPTSYFIHSWMVNYEAINYYYRVKLRYLNLIIVYSHESNVTCL